nr:desulfoferrodoxin [Clostridia bacterium]
MKHLICEVCGNLVAMINDAGVDIYCCGQPMDEVVPESRVDDAKHAPSIRIKGDVAIVSVGDDEHRHPQSREHGIRWVCLVTDLGSHRRLIGDEEEPTVEIPLDKDERPIRAFAYCNLHGLRVTDCK